MQYRMVRTPSSASGQPAWTTMLGACALVAALAATVGCADVRLPDQVAVVEQDPCASCHVGESASAVPGAPHAAHEKFGCGECHAVPDGDNDEGHLEDRGAGDVIFGDRSRLGGAQPSFDGTSCSSVYCHGADAEPIAWAPAVEPAGCATCHGAPPAPPHIQNDNCDLCHDDGTENAHIDGTLQLIEWKGSAGQPACGDCHAIPPAAPHPQNVGTCRTCHGVAFLPDHGELNSEVHMNGTVDMGGAE